MNNYSQSWGLELTDLFCQKKLLTSRPPLLSTNTKLKGFGLNLVYPIATEFLSKISFTDKDKIVDAHNQK